MSARRRIHSENERNEVEFDDEVVTILITVVEIVLIP